MHSRAEYYRRRGLEAQQRAAQTTDLSLKEAFKDVARDWFAVAEQVDWLDLRTSEQTRTDEAQNRPGKKRGRKTTDGSQRGSEKPHTRSQREESGTSCWPERKSGTS
jgi:hypothetical protein